MKSIYFLSCVMERVEAIGIIEGLDAQNKQYDAAKVFFEQDLQQGDQSDHEKRAEHYYYLLRIMVKKHVMIDNPITQQYFELLKKEAIAQEQKLLEAIALPTDMRHMQMQTMQLKAFYKMIERYFASLEIEFDHLGFAEFKEKAYVEKMQIRTKRFHLHKEWGKFFLYKSFEWSSYFGLSFLRWFTTVALITFLFGCVYFVSDHFTTVRFLVFSEASFIEYLGLSWRIFTLSYSPMVFGVFQQLVLMCELALGYGMLGILIGIILRRF